MTPNRPIDRILELARWAPSGDNTQPWRFERVDDFRAVVHGFDTRAHCVYDLDGRPSQIALGALLETASIAASVEGFALNTSLRAGLPDTQPTIDLQLLSDPSLTPSPLAPAIPLRSVQRRMMHLTALTAAQKAALEASVGPGFDVRWVEGFGGRLRVALMLFRSARLRLTMPEAYQVHRDIIEWNAQFSTDRVPDQALGASGPSIALMRFAMASWDRVRFMNRYLAGTWIPRIELDLLPGIACAAHFALVARGPVTALEHYLTAGRAVQRFWLTATQLGLVLQPEITPLVFARYAREGRAFSATPGTQAAARAVAADLGAALGHDVANSTVFMGRVGTGPAVRARSLRREVAGLLQKGGS
jgi:nitroreductase